MRACKCPTCTLPDSTERDKCRRVEQAAEIAALRARVAELERMIAAIIRYRNRPSEEEWALRNGAMALERGEK